MSLTLDVFNKKKQETQGNVYFLDRRKFKGGRSKEENLREELIKELDALGLKNDQTTNNLLKLGEKIKFLNFYLLINVYNYFQSKNFNLGLVVLNFNEDFKEEYRKIKLDNPYVVNMEDPLIEHKYRQDYIVYLFLLDELDLSSGDFYSEILEEENYLDESEQYEGAEDFENDNPLGDEFEQDY